MKIMVTGFGRFLEYDNNPTKEVLKILPKSIYGNEIISVELPVIFDECFDYLKPMPQKNLDQWYSFVTDVANNFLNAYLPILNRRKNLPFTEDQKEWQEIRRGRYVEFNLIFDRGTLFGLQSNGRTESILMSMPPMVQWKYDWKPETGSKEEKLYTYFLTNKDWLSHE